MNIAKITKTRIKRDLCETNTRFCISYRLQFPIKIYKDFMLTAAESYLFVPTND